MKVGIINATGYIGMDLARLLLRHPRVEVAWVTGRGAAGQRLGDYLPHLDTGDMPILAEPGDADLVFSALPHKSSAEALQPIIERGTRVIDLSADFRLKDAAEYRRWYEVEHPNPSLLAGAVYGLPELHRAEIAGAQIVASPGCYPTAALLALAPAVKEGLVEPDIIVDAKSGVSGAGRELSLTTHYSEVNESVTAYALTGHRHLPEMLQELRALNPTLSPTLTFMPHLIPMTRGILATCYARLRQQASQAQIDELYREFYRDAPFVTVVGFSPQTKQTLGSNHCLVHPVVDEASGRLIALSALDNLVKGGAGQAVQCMNLMLDLPETTGVDALAVFP
ncbi:MAG: N-acetyl-gamma-glutamyl-phosphate reductase [Dehalococcoidia bacterium]